MLVPRACIISLNKILDEDLGNVELDQHEPTLMRRKTVSFFSLLSGCFRQ